MSNAMTPAQTKALNELSACPAFSRNREGWSTPAGRFVALIVVAKLRNRGLAQLSADKRAVSITAKGRSSIHKESPHA